MRIDFYTKAVLTVIAIALVWIAASGSTGMPTVHAQDDTATRVIVVGWEEADGKTMKLPPIAGPNKPEWARFPVQ